MNSCNELKWQDVVIKPLDEALSPQMTWKLVNAWAVKIEGPGFQGDGNEATFESITLAYEEMKIGEV